MIPQSPTVRKPKILARDKREPSRGLTREGPRLSRSNLGAAGIRALPHDDERAGGLGIGECEVTVLHREREARGGDRFNEMKVRAVECRAGTRHRPNRR